MIRSPRVDAAGRIARGFEEHGRANVFV